MIDTKIALNNQDMEAEKEKMKAEKKKREVSKLFKEFGYDKTEEYKVATKAIENYENKAIMKKVQT